MPISRPRLHLIGNSHLDPVWLWDWREGLTEGIATCQSILRLMDEFPELTYIRGETAIYEHLSRYAPHVFRDLRARISEGRWEVVGGTYLQPDTNLPATEVLTRHFTQGLRFCGQTLGVRPVVAWAADAFGHSAGFPEILASAGMKYFAFSRPHARDLVLPGPAFWWEATSGRRILCWRLPLDWYGNERGDMKKRLDASLAYATAHQLPEIAVFYGLGNHGGGPCRQHLLDIRRWREGTPEAEVIHSTLEGFFQTLAGSCTTFPVFRGELNFTLRGCYSSASRFKASYRRAESQLLSVERTLTACGLLNNRPPRPDRLAEPWRSVLFNTFHDILPGTSIERAMTQQADWLGAALHQTRAAELQALHELSAEIDTRPPEPRENMPAAVPVLLWNSQPYPFSGQIEIEACLDYRPIFAYEKRPAEVPVQLHTAEGEPVPFQVIETEHGFLPSLPWRKRLVAAVTIPPLGWRVLHFGWTESPRLAPPPPSPAQADPTNTIHNEFYRIDAHLERSLLHVWHRGRKIWGERGLRIASYDDRWGSWGGHEGEPEANDISQDPQHWSISQIEILERGPLRAALWVEFSHGASRLSLTLRLAAGLEQISIHGRLFWCERGRRLKLELPVAGTAVFDVPGGSVQRGECGEVPGGRWIVAGDAKTGWVLANDSFYNYDLKDGTLRTTLVRSTRYAWTEPGAPTEQLWRPYQDLGEHAFQLALAPHGASPARLAESLESPPIVWAAPAHKGHQPTTGSVGTLSPPWQLLALKSAEDGKGVVLRAQNAADIPSPGRFTCLGHEIDLGTLAPSEIGTWLLCGQAALKPTRIDAAEGLPPAIEPRKVSVSDEEPALPHVA